MRLFSTFSKRRKAQSPVKLVYNELPEKLRAQIVIVLRGAFGTDHELLGVLEAIVSREIATVSFMVDRGNRYEAGPNIAFQCILRGNFEEAIDAFDLAMQLLNRGTSERRKGYSGAYDRVFMIEQRAEDSIAEVNARFLEHNVGYQFSIDQNQTVELDSELLHKEAVEPAMKLLSAPGFEGPAQEYAEAHQHHRAGNGKDALTAAVRALESTVKAICDKRGWTYDQKRATMKPLFDVLFSKGFIPQDLEGHFSGLRAALESGLPTLGNRLARHGQGSQVRHVEDHMVAFGMHLCAAAIVFLVETHRSKR